MNSSPARLSIASRLPRGINIEDFRSRHVVDASARKLFYKDLDSGKFPSMPHSWTLAPLNIRQFYRTLALRIEEKPAPSRWARFRSFIQKLRQAGAPS